MYIAPNSNIKILRNCPLDPTYEHTLYFANATAQVNYFNTLVKYTFTKQSYTRVMNGVIRVQVECDKLYDCNYLMFQNNNFGSTKWFYAFITKIEYINNITTEITFELDVMQTWAFDYTLGQCFIEREHTSTDKVGEHIIEENLETGEYITGSEYQRPYFESIPDSYGHSLSDLCYVLVSSILSSASESYPTYDGQLYNGIYSGLEFRQFPNSNEGVSALRDVINSITTAGKKDSIVGVYLMPEIMARYEMTTRRPPLNFTILGYGSGDRFEGYTPKNNKLYTYPYNFLYCTNNQGNSCVYRYELFGTPTKDKQNFVMFGDMSQVMSVCIAPKDYAGIKNINYDESISISGYPQLPWSGDVYKTWVAQHGTSFAVSSIGGVLSGITQIVGGGVGVAMGNPLGAVSIASGVTNIGSTVAGSMAKLHEAKIQPPQSHSGTGNMAMINYGVLDFHFYHKSITRDYAISIDNYFSKFGYACHRVKVPNRNVRPHWCYTKTVGCVIKGSIPSEDIATICNIYNNGVTFWKNGSEVGNYSLDNSV